MRSIGTQAEKTIRETQCRGWQKKSTRKEKKLCIDSRVLKLFVYMVIQNRKGKVGQDVGQDEGQDEFMLTT